MSKSTTIWILGDQLNPRISALESVAPSECVVLMIESLAIARRRPYHKQKLALLWSAMRHFGLELRELGYEVDYYSAQPHLKPALEAHMAKHHPTHMRLTETAEYGRSKRLARILKTYEVEVQLTPNNMLLSEKAEFARDARGKKRLLMETFYRKMRRKTGLLMEGGEPEGRQWNYDRLNRERPAADHVFPPIPRFEPDEITRSVIDMVEREFPAHFGELDGFWMPITRQDAERFFDDFLEHRLDLFGPYEDAIVSGEPGLYHSLISSLLNIGLLEPLDVCCQAETCFYRGHARLNSVEGFIRQIIGWREFMYQVYHLKMPDYAELNFFEADLPLPDFYWNGDTDMYCVADAVKNLRHYGTNHHIQRLMITGNFALLAGIDPQAVNEWYWLAYTDAYEWVVTPNVLGLALYADGGLITTKPYAASANYINRMSDCCLRCVYDHRRKTGEKACPFNSLYWDFLSRNRDRLKTNPRMNLTLALLDKRTPEEMKSLQAQANHIRDKLILGKPV
jgi:deoxyribodipyrimidine photolyase-related protein